jgi:hypothetical protein
MIDELRAFDPFGAVMHHSSFHFPRAVVNLPTCH